MGTYAVYGLRVASEWALTGYAPATGPADVRLTAAPEAAFHPARASGAHHAADGEWLHDDGLSGGETYLRHASGLEFLVAADGGEVRTYAPPGVSLEGLQAYLLGQVISFVLLQRGLEPLHATVVETACGAVGFLGDSGTGKSTLAAAFLGQGDALVTDDLLVATRTAAGFVVEPGPPRLKLFPGAAAFHGAPLTGAPMNPLTAKMMIPLRGAGAAVPLRALYVLAPRRAARSERVLLRRLTGRRAFEALMRGTYNTYVESAGRMQRQFRHFSDLASAVPIGLLSYPRRLDVLERVRQRVLADACG